MEETGAKKKNIMVEIMPESVMYTRISKSNDGYNSAGVTMKLGDSTYMNIGVEWSSKDDIPTFAMDLMKMLMSNDMKANAVVEEYSEEYAKYQELHNKREE